MTVQRPQCAAASAPRKPGRGPALIGQMDREVAERSSPSARPPALAARPRLFAALEAAFPVVFRPWEAAKEDAEP